MKIHSISFTEITIPENRQRREINYEQLTELAGSISQNGIIHPVVVRRGENGTYLLVAGERRLKALDYLWTFGEAVRCGKEHFPAYFVPCIYLGDLDEIDAFEIELEENIRRIDLSWQEKAAATSQLAELRRLQADRDGNEPPTTATIAAEVYPDYSKDEAVSITRKELIVNRYVKDPEVAKAKTLDEAFKLIKRQEEAQKNVALGELVGKTFSAADHQLVQGNCLSIMQEMVARNEQFDVILTDPPYGINAQEFGDSGGAGGSTGAHFYDDSPQSWRYLMEPWARLAHQITKPEAHCYAFCDIDMFTQFKIYMLTAGWQVFRTPLAWVNPGGMRAPWPESGPQRKYQLILYAIKGNKRVTKLYPDVITSPADPNLGHPATKPVAVYLDLLRRSVKPGDSVLDPFCGSGTIFPAAHKAMCRATGIELDPAAYGLAAKRLGELK
jgi:ParB/RepB/Spo0J family partition protein